jgi:GxxExxY protein
MMAGGESEISEELNQVSKEILGAAIEVHRHLGPGLLENIYEEALLYEMKLRGLVARSQVTVPVQYKDLTIEGQRLDILVEPGVIVEVKAVSAFREEHQAQLIGYLKATGHRLGLLINFNFEVLHTGIKRIVV